MYPYNPENAYGRPPIQAPPGIQMPPGFGFPPGLNPAGSGPPNFTAPGAPGSTPHAAQASGPNRQGIPAFTPPASLPNINFNAPIIRLGTASTKQQPLPGGSSHQQSPGLSHPPANSKAPLNQNSNSSSTRESASGFIPPTIDEQLKSVFVGSLPPFFEDQWIERILKAAGPVRRWIRVSDEGGKPRNYGFCEYETFEGVLAALTAIHELSIIHPDDHDKTSNISVTNDDRADDILDKLKTQEATDAADGGSGAVDIGSRYESIRLAISGIISEYSDPDRHLDARQQDKTGNSDKNQDSTDDDLNKTDQGQPEVVTISLTIDDELADIPADMRETVSKEIAAFRERSNRRDVERIKREEEIEQQERDRISGGRGYRFVSPPASAPTGPSAGPNSIPIGPSRLRNDIPFSAPTGPAAQSVKFVNGSTSRLPQEDEDSDASDSELEFRRKQKKTREVDAIFLDHERRWLNRERSRTSAIERESVRDKEDVRREEIERGAMALRLSEWNDDVEMDRRVEDYYIDRSLWIRNRAQFRSREKEMDTRDRAAEERLLDSEKRASEARTVDSLREKVTNKDEQASEKEPQQPRIKLSLGASVRNKATDLTRPRRTVADIEGLLEDEEEDSSKTRRVLVPIQYEDSVGADDESREELVKALAQEIPSDKNGLWNWKVNWEFVDDAMIKEKLQPFVEKKIVEYLGVQEQELINFVLEHIKRRGSATDLVKELEMALDEDAEVLNIQLSTKMMREMEEGTNAPPTTSSNLQGSAQFATTQSTSHSGFRRQRASRACETCHARKVRCDAASLGVPCTNCVAFSIECKIPTPKRKKAALSEAKQKEDESQVKLNQDSKSASPGAAPRVVVRDQPPYEADEPSLSTITPDSLAEPEASPFVQFLKPKFARAPIKDAGRVAYLGESSNLSLLVHDRHGASDVVHYPLPESIRGARAQLTELDSEEIDILNRRGAFLLPPRALCDELVDAFFRHIAPIVPVINHNRFMQRYRDPANPPSLLLLQAVLLAGSRVCTNPALMDASGSTTPAALTFYKRAKALYDANYEDDRVTIVQSLILMGWYWEGPEDVTKNVFYWSRVATVVAQGSGMHRSVERSQLSRADKRIWKRIWWTLFTRDRSVAVALGRPVHINTDDSDVEMISEDDFDEDEPGASVEYKPNPLHVKFFLHYVKLCEIMGLVLSQQYSVALRTRRHHVIDLTHSDMALADWMINLPEEMKYHMNDVRRQNFWAALLHSTYYTTLCLLHRAHMPPATLPDSAHLNNTISGYPSRKIAFQAAANITAIIQNLRAHDELKYCPAFIVYSLFSALIMQVYQVRSSQPAIVAITQDRMKVCMEALKEVSKIWLVAKMVYTLFDSILGNKALEERLAKTSGYRRSGDKARRSDASSRKITDTASKRKFEDIDLGTISAGPTPQMSYERSRPQTPTVSPGLKQQQSIRQTTTIHGHNLQHPFGGNSHAASTSDNVRSYHQHATGFLPNIGVPTTPPDFFLVTKSSPPISQALWENFQPNQLFPEESGNSGLENIPSNHDTTPQLPKSSLVDATSQSFASSLQTPPLKPKETTHLANSPDMQIDSSHIHNGDLNHSSLWAANLDVDTSMDSPDDSWSNSSSGLAQSAPTTLNVEDWYQFFGLSAGFDINQLGLGSSGG
ncbi:Transcriptional activator of fatty acid utilization [Orbilia oligospora]|uniref:Transcriptional activator of fatty acid utilization n=1 Tax=Orbilia oligospora TaxID=2813651 RepID=A0A7C8Q8M1_ORBOL|nr:Transcriptional activator of fatty acid utilization [Orbilia oligospora]